jgi:hypothetical protein
MFSISACSNVMKLWLRRYPTEGGQIRSKGERPLGRDSGAIPSASRRPLAQAMRTTIGGSLSTRLDMGRSPHWTFCEAFLEPDLL